MKHTINQCKPQLMILHLSLIIYRFIHSNIKVINTILVKLNANLPCRTFVMCDVPLMRCWVQSSILNVKSLNVVYVLVRILYTRLNLSDCYRYINCGAKKSHVYFSKGRNTWTSWTTFIARRPDLTHDSLNGRIAFLTVASYPDSLYIIS